MVQQVSKKFKTICVLEGGYDLDNLCECSETVFDVLLGNWLDGKEEIEIEEGVIQEVAVKNLKEVREIQRAHWDLPVFPESLTIQENQTFR